MTVGPGNNHPPRPDGELSAPARIPQSLVDAFLDGELDAARTRQLFEGLRADPAAGEELAKTRRILNGLKHTPVPRDTTHTVLARIHRRRHFLPLPLRRLVTAGRAGVAAVLLAGVLGAAVVQRVSPNAVRFTPAPAPIAAVERAGSDGAMQVRQSAGVVVETIRLRLAQPVADCVAIAADASCREPRVCRVEREPLSRVACGSDPLQRDWNWGTREIVFMTGAGNPAWNAAGGIALVEPQRAGMLPLGFLPGGDPVSMGRGLVGSPDSLLVLPAGAEVGAAREELLERLLRGAASEWHDSGDR